MLLFYSMELIEGEDLELVLDICRHIEGHTVCPLGDAAVWPIQSSIRHFRSEWEEALAGRRPVAPPEAPFAAPSAAGFTS